MWWIYHCAADNLICEGRSAVSLLLRALFYRPTAAVSWKILAQSAVAGFTRRASDAP
jgi:hypothetical protein